MHVQNLFGYLNADSIRFSKHYKQVQRKMRQDLQDKVDRALRLLSSLEKFSKGAPIELCYSGGKDSDVILELAKMASINFKAVYKNTTVDPPGTIAHCLSNNVLVVDPKYSFFDIIRRKGFPTRWRRFCCSILKEYNVFDTSILGIRRCESVKRNARYFEPIVCRIYKGHKGCVQQAFPILDWSDKDLETFIYERSIVCHPLYYDDDKCFHVERRLGCLCCPLKSDNGLSDFKKYPRMVRAWIRAGREWWFNHPIIGVKSKFNSVEEVFVRNVFFHDYNDYKRAMSGLFGTIDAKELLEDYFQIDLS